MTELQQNYLTSMEVADMLGVEHFKVIRKLEGDKDRKGYIEILTDSQMGVSDYFQESAYVDASGKSNKCYNITKLGCDFLANKFTGEKGVLFTAKYVKRFRDMEKYITDSKATFTLNAEDYTKAILAVADNLKTDNVSKIVMLKKGYNEVGIPSGFLPEYTTDNNDKVAFSATDLLKKNKCEMSIHQFNKALLAYGFLETKSRPSSKGGVKEFKALTDKGLAYGKNVVNQHNVKEVQPLYWEDTFMELYEIISK